MVDDTYTAHLSSVTSFGMLLFAKITMADVQAWMTLFATVISVLCGILAIVLYVKKIKKITKS